MMSQSAAAPEKTRTEVNVAASMLVCFSAARQRSELLAKAIIASDVRKKIREDFIASLRGNTKQTPNAQHPSQRLEGTPLSHGRRKCCVRPALTSLVRTAPDYNPRTPASNRSTSSGVV